MALTLSSIFLSLRESINGLTILCAVILIINIILWVYVVKTKRLLSKLEKKLNDTNYKPEIRLAGSGERSALTEEELKEDWLI